ncbi:hypothetical protein [Asticcacaulis benevestitus]|nr:hypothetical protein [Asticcacaulis benevestitus]
MPELSLPVSPSAAYVPPVNINMPESESRYPGIWEWMPAEAPLQAKRPLGGSEGVPETQPDSDDLLNIAMTVIAGIGLTVALTTALRIIFRR